MMILPGAFKPLVVRIYKLVSADLLHKIGLIPLCVGDHIRARAFGQLNGEGADR